MENYIYILTDSNRSFLHVGMTDNLQEATRTHRELTRLFFNTQSNASRLVYHEALPSDSAALLRFKEVSGYTRMQKERLIRRYNPNWLDLGIAPTRAGMHPVASTHPGRLSTVTSRARS